MAGISSMPDAVLQKVAERAQEEMRKRGLAPKAQLYVNNKFVGHASDVKLVIKDEVVAQKLAGEWRDANPKIVEAWKRDPHETIKIQAAAEQLDHANAVAQTVRGLAKIYHWSDDFMLMIDVRGSTKWRLVFRITSSLGVNLPGSGFKMLMAGDVVTLDMRIHRDQVESTINHLIPGVNDAIAKCKLTVPNLPPSADPFFELKRRHPFAQPSDFDAIAKWEASNVGSVHAPEPSRVAATKELPNALVVRGGHDAAGWLRD